MDVAEWADEAYSEEMPVLRARGEGPKLEYIVSFPSNATELAREIAAFASTDGGTILLGVSNDGTLEGLDGLENLAGRDALMRRLEGLCHGQIKPSITPSAVFAVEDDRIVLVIHVPRGEQPVYYCHGKPYVRHLTESRPAEPHEVIERVARYLAGRPGAAVVRDAEDDDTRRRSAFVSDVAVVLRDLLMWADEADDRPINPGLRDLMFQFEFAGGQLRVLASSEAAAELKLEEGLRELGDTADAVAHHRHTLGRESRQAFLEKIRSTRGRAAELWNTTVAPIPLAEETRAQARDTLRQLTRQLASLQGRAATWVDAGRLNELQADVSALGRQVTELAYLGLKEENEEWTSEVRAVGHRLHLVDMIRFHMGGTEIAELMELIESAASDLKKLVYRMDEE